MRSKFLLFAVMFAALFGARAQSPVYGIPNSPGSPVFWPAQSGSQVFGLPVTSLPNFGNATIGASGFNTVGAFMAGSYFTAAHSGTYVTFHIFCESGTGASFFGVYPAPGGNASGQTLIAQGTYTCPAGWATGSISVPVVAGNTYFFAAQSSASTFGIAWDSTTGSAAFAAGTGGTMPTTAPAFSSQTGNYSMYLSQP